MEGEDLTAVYNDQDAWLDYFVLLTLLISEVGCFISVIDYSFMGIFIFEETKSVDGSELHPQHDFSFFDEEAVLIDMTNVQLQHPLNSRPHSLGKVFVGKYSNRLVVVRRMKFPRLSGYILENVKEETAVVQDLGSEFLVRLVGVSLDAPVIYFVHEYIPTGSLFERLHTNHETFTPEQKVSILSSLAACLRMLHACSLVHGHLTSHNVFVTNTFSVKIADFGFQKLKKYAGLVFGYSNKSHWSSPAILAGSERTVSAPTASDDVYSFGVIAWELFTLEVPRPSLAPQTSIPPRIWELIQKATEESSNIAAITAMLANLYSR